MKNSTGFLCAATVALTAALCRADYASEVMADSPEAYYRFEDPILTNWMGDVHHSLDVSNVVFEAGPVGTAGTFSSNSLVELDLRLNPANSDFSIEVLARFDVTDINRTLVKQVGGRTLLYRMGSGKMRTYLGGSSTTSSSAAGQDEWHHIVVTFEKDTSGSAETIRFYIDGQPAGSGSETAESDTGNWILGNNSLIGALDEVAIYDDLLTADRIVEHYEEIVPTPVHYVSTNGSSVWPYTNWVTAATDIQDAVDAAAAGNTVLVSNGTFTSSSEITVFKAITIESVNGPDVTIVDGQNAHRCLNLGNSACILSGITIQNGDVGFDDGGGVYCSGAMPVVTNCTLIGNSAGDGGGSYGGTLYSCFLLENNADYGGGSHGGSLYSCLISDNSADEDGGGSYGGMLNHCTITGNSAGSDSEGGYGMGGGNYGGEVVSSIIWGNTAGDSGDDLYFVEADYSCSPDLTHGPDGNITNAPLFADASGRLHPDSPCIDAGSTHEEDMVVLADLDGTPRPQDGDGNGSAIPDMGAYEFAPPQVDITNVNTTVFGEVTTYSIGGTNSGSVVGFMDWTNPATGGSGIFAASNEWQVADIPLAFGANRIAVSGTNVFGGSASDTVKITRGVVHGGDSSVHYVSTNGLSLWPYTNWVTAATNIQDAVDVAVAGDKVLVTNGTYSSAAQITVTKAITIEGVNGRDVTIVDGQNAHRCFDLDSTACTLSGFTIQNGDADDDNGGGVYCSGTVPIINSCTLTGNRARSGGGSYGGTLSNCILFDNSAIWNGADTVGDGGGSYEGTLSNCAIISNSAYSGGGGIYEGTLNNCTLSGNSANYGGGSHDGTLNNCTLSGNSANYGGGSFHSQLRHCTLTGNSANYGGGINDGTLYNCIVWSNTATASGHNWFCTDDHDEDPSLNMGHSCSTPLRSGRGNITNAPLFADAAGRLLPGSPCIDTGMDLETHIGVLVTNDLDGTARPLDGNADGTNTVDMGAYEYFNAAADSDGDGSSDGDEQTADTGILDSNDWFCVTAFTSNSIVTFDSSDERQYTLQYCTNLTEAAWSNVTDQVDIMGIGGELTLTDPAPTNSPCFYRVQVEIPVE